MKIASWNVNSIRVRLERALAFLERHEPDVLCLQELKVTDDIFPAQDFESAGYNVTRHGQKTYNGVAVLTRKAPSEVQIGLNDGVDDPQARFLSVDVEGVRVICVYVPNGQAVGSDKWQYKLAWYSRLKRHLETRCSPDQPLVLCGDFNVAIDERDLYDPAGWEDTVLYHPEIRETLAGVTRWGLKDTFRLHHQDGGRYSWWDYRAGAFHKGLGLRIDFIFATEPLAGRCTDASIDREERKGKQPSDHAPVLATFDF